MLRVTIVGLLAAIYFSALFGWGQLAEKLFGIRLPFPLTLCLGMASWIFLGGVLNLVGIAYPLVLDSIVLLGLGNSALLFFRSWNSKVLLEVKTRYFSRNFLARFLPSMVLVATVFVFCAHTLSSPKAFNFHDDMEKYFSHPIRMVATGSLRAGHFNTLGSATLGGQAFLQGFAVSHWPVAYVNTVDSVLGLTLCLICVLGVCVRLRLAFWFIALVVAVPVVINPQYVNISASYTASALILLLFLGTWISIRDANASTALPHPAFLGLVYSALIVLKTSFVPVALVHFMVLLVLFICILRPWKRIFSWTAKVTASTFIFALPWILLYSSQLLTLLSNMGRHNILRAPGTEYYRFPKPTTNLFSLDPLFWGFGDTFAHYTLTTIFVGCCCLALLMYKFLNKQTDKIRTSTAIAACATLPIAYFVSIIVVAPRFAGSETGLRYLCPVIIAVTPAALIMAAAAFSGCGQQKDTVGLWPKRPIVILAFFSIAILLAFSGSFSGRVKQALQHGSTLSFQHVAAAPHYLAYNSFALGPAAEKKVQKAQQVVPEGVAMLAWTPLALHLDYGRNHIISVEPGGLTIPWLDFPFGQGPDEGTKYLKNMGVHYVLWQYRGYAVRSEKHLKQRAASPFYGEHIIGVRTNEFVKMLISMASDSQILYNDGSILVMTIILPQNSARDF